MPPDLQRHRASPVAEVHRLAGAGFDGVAVTVVVVHANLEPRLHKEARNTPFCCPSQEKCHTFVLRGVRIFLRPRKIPLEFLL